MDYFKHSAKCESVRQAEAAGEVADSMDVRKALMERFHAGELTLDQVKAELTRIKRNAKKNGQVSRASVYRHS